MFLKNIVTRTIIYLFIYFFIIILNIFYWEQCIGIGDDVLGNIITNMIKHKIIVICNVPYARMLNIVYIKWLYSYKEGTFPRIEDRSEREREYVGVGVGQEC